MINSEHQKKIRKRKENQEVQSHSAK